MVLREIGWEGVEHLAQDKDQWQALVNMINLQVPLKAGNFLTT
jgi:hypothetical protein